MCPDRWVEIDPNPSFVAPEGAFHKTCQVWDKKNPPMLLPAGFDKPNLRNGYIAV